jgi:hypothetical protein
MILAFRGFAHPLPQFDQNINFFVSNAFDNFLIAIGKAIGDNDSRFMQPLNLTLAVVHLPLPSMQYKATQHNLEAPNCVVTIVYERIAASREGV